MNNLIITEENSSINEFDFPENKIIDLNLNIEILKKENGLDIFLSDFIVDNLSEMVYDNILIPLSFGNILSDYLGLRLAFHIRTTKTLNQCSNIYIYGTERIENLLINDFSKIIYSKGVRLIDYSKSKIIQALNNKSEKLSSRNLSSEISKITLSIPKNYYDNHSISNEWAISRWSRILNAEDDDGIAKVNRAVNSNLYFKYLKTVHQTNELKPIIETELKIKNNGRVLLIDDELNKGWGEIFDYLLGELNNIYIDNLGWDFSKQTRENIISESINKIINDSIDLVILDFRLHPEDFKEQNIEKVTGYKLLKEIKKYNKGIQVIIFSATNKIWNLQALSEAGADGFVIKESIVNSSDGSFTKQSVLEFKSTINIALERKFLKNIYSLLAPIIKRVELNISIKPKNYNLKIQQCKLLNYLEYLQSADLLLYSNHKNLKYCFLQLILVIEDIIKGFYIESSDKDQYVDISIYEKVMCLEKSLDKIKLILKPIEGLDKFIEGEHNIYKDDEHFKLFNNQGDRIPFNYRLNCVLYFKYKIDLDQASKYSSLYKLRSRSVAHLGGANVKEIDILNSLELLNILIQ